MRGLRSAVPASVAVALFALAPSPAHASPQARGDRIVVPVRTIAGSTAGELLGEWWQQILALPNDANPFGLPTGVPQCVQIGHRGRVTAPAGTPNECTVKVGEPVVIPAFTAECSSAEPDPFHGDTAAEQRACALNVFTSLLNVTAINVSVDDAAPVDIHGDRFAVLSPQTHVTYPTDPIFDAETGPATFVAYGWMAKLRRLRPGRHSITGEVLVDGDIYDTFSTALTVERHRGHDS